MAAGYLVGFVKLIIVLTALCRANEREGNSLVGVTLYRLQFALKGNIVYLLDKISPIAWLAWIAASRLVGFCSVFPRWLGASGIASSGHASNLLLRGEGSLALLAEDPLYDSLSLIRAHAFCTNIRNQTAHPFDNPFLETRQPSYYSPNEHRLVQIIHDHYAHSH